MRRVFRLFFRHATLLFSSPPRVFLCHHAPDLLLRHMSMPAVDVISALMFLPFHTMLMFFFTMPDADDAHAD